MNDTPQHIQDLQLQLWLSKTPGERLYQFLVDNDTMLQALIKTKKELNIPLGELDLNKQFPAKR
jgi:hypothetical protein